MKVCLPTLVCGLAVSAACADGGVPIASRSDGGARLTLLMQPATAQPGPVRFTLLGAVQRDMTLEATGDGFREVTTMVPEPGVPGLHATVDVERSGFLRVLVHAAEAGEHVLAADLQVGEADPPWRTRLPWLTAWVPMLAVVWLRRWRLARRVDSRRPS